MAVLKVRAIAGGDVRWAGYYDLRRRKPGDEFILKTEGHFSHLWMEPIGWTPKAKTDKDALVAKERIKPSTGAMGARQTAGDRVKAGKAASLSQVSGKVAMSADNPVPATVKEVNTEDTSHNTSEEVI